jgi:hypothetical protein
MMADPEQKPRNKQPLSKESWAALSAVAVALIGAAVTVFTTTYKPSSPDGRSLPATVVPSSLSEEKPADIPLGTWKGMAKEPSGSVFPIAVTIDQACRPNQPCGNIRVPEVPCKGEISLVNIANGYLEFSVDHFDASSDANICKAGGGELLRLLPDGSLAYKTTYSKVEGVLKHVW